MCLNVKRGTGKKHAVKDIQVYKIISAGNAPVYQGGTPYEAHKLYQLDSELKIEGGVVNEGFHAYTTYKAAVNIAGKSNKVVIAIIPRGAKYVEGSAGDIVADKLLIISLDSVK